MAEHWPDRKGKTTQQTLPDLVRFQERNHVRESVGELRGECFTDEEFADFTRADTPTRIVERLEQAPDFSEVADALRALSPVQRAGA